MFDNLDLDSTVDTAFSPRLQHHLRFQASAGIQVTALVVVGIAGFQFYQS